MAASYHAAAVPRHRCRRFAPELICSRTANMVVCGVSTSFPSKTTRRKNRLREKILKTLELPDITKPSLIPIDSPPVEEAGVSGTIQEGLEEKCERSEAGNQEVENLQVEVRAGNQEVENLQVEVRAGNDQVENLQAEVRAGNEEVGSIVVPDKNSVLKYGVWLLGAFLFQTVCAVWAFGSSGFGDNTSAPVNEESSVTELVGNGKDRSSVRVVLKGENGAADSFIYVNELEMESKIVEIRAMAREVREKERLESEKSGYDSEKSEDEADGERHSKSVIEEEVDDRLIRLRKKLENARKKMPMASAGNSVKDSIGKAEVKKGESDEDDGNGALLFRRKYKFKDSPTDPVRKPKGFTGSVGYEVVNSEENGGVRKEDELLEGNGDDRAVDIGDEEKLQDAFDVESKHSDENYVVEEYEEKTELEMSEPMKNTRRYVTEEEGNSKEVKGIDASKPKAMLMEKNSGSNTLGAVKPRKSNVKVLKSRKPNDRKNGVRDERIGDFKSAAKSKTGLWWLKLPYVLVIIIQRGDYDKGSEGFYVLKSISGSKNRTSHIVAFEDQADANNFCYLLESFFEDMEGFRADVVPLTAQELSETVKSRAMRPIVVKKGQLQLYAGQPLSDAEMALRSLIERG
ncbi:uncharacterized protein LOC127248991 [Andrographis paniculata]|uniref:uncharacterized protein LOC127248991 n=1 Tax=Andrographis paniculata TaxID=175694 RepID=UPI0021E96040|nr:uncharacterized protein LOC127248991 [Andrographis paniculata]XP_051127530.1 uncharacterized protein LOC127248991 [Andrographis paniculata]